MIVIKEDKDWYLLIYSDSGKKILEVNNGSLWDNSVDEPIAVNKERFNNGDYIESDVDVEPLNNNQEDYSLLD